MTWAHPVVLAAIPVALVATWFLLGRRRRVDDGAFTNIKRLWADRRGLSDTPAATRRPLLRGVCLAAGISATLLALARPQWGEVAEPRYDDAREVMLALDLSRSMLADDVAPSRLARAKLLIDALLDQLKGERVGLIVFSGTAFVQSPLSADYEVLRDLLSALDPSYLPEGGTDYESMLRTAVQAFGQQGDGDRYLVVLSDGEALDQNWKSLLPALRERGIHVIGLGVGTPAGALVPDGAGGLVKDEHGAAVLSRLEPATLQALAAETDGTYREATTWVDVAELIDATVEQGRKGHYVEQRNVRLQDRYQWVLAAALLLLLLSYWIEFPLPPLARALPTRGRRPHPASAPAIAAALMALAAWRTPCLASAAVPDSLALQSGTASQPNPLTATVAELSAKPDLGGADYARLATDTIQFASQPNPPPEQMRAGVIDDALAAVDRGEAIDARAADWPALRRQLEQLKQEKAEPPKEPPRQDRKQEQAAQQPHGDSQVHQEGNGGEQPQQNEQGAGQPSEPPQGSKSGADKPASAAESKPDRDGAKGAGDRDGQSAGADSSAPSAPSAAAADEARDRKPDGHQPPGAAAGEVPRTDDVKPLDAPAAGLGDQNQPDQKDRENAAPAAPRPDAESATSATQPSSRMVGGGRALQGTPPQGETALAEAIDKMERVKDGDAPAVLFDRMNRAEGQPRAAKHGKNW